MAPISCHTYLRSRRCIRATLSQIRFVVWARVSESRRPLAVSCTGDCLERLGGTLADSILFCNRSALLLRVRSFMRCALTERERLYASGWTLATSTRKPFPCTVLPQCLQLLLLKTRGRLSLFFGQWWRSCSNTRRLVKYRPQNLHLLSLGDSAGISLSGKIL